MKDPDTPAEWQDAVNWAEACLLVDDARLYGLIRGGPQILVTRCEHILERGRAQQIVPTTEGVDACVHALCQTAYDHGVTR